MNVIVKGMKMPDCCGGCELNDSDDDGIYCTVLEVFMRFDELPKGRRSDCPLTELILCKDCKYYERADKRSFYRGYDCLNGRIASIVPDKDYCSRAERKEE